MLLSSRVHISKHALARYRERFDEGASLQVVRNRVVHARRAYRYDYINFNVHPKLHDVFLVDRDAMFVLHCKSAGRFVVKTCLKKKDVVIQRKPEQHEERLQSAQG